MIAALPIAICGVFQIVSLYYASGKLSFLRSRMMYSEKHRNDIWGRRNKSIWTSIYYTVTYLVTWTLIAACYIALNEVANVTDQEVRSGYSDSTVQNLGYATACLYALQPCPMALLWIILYVWRSSVRITQSLESKSPTCNISRIFQHTHTHTHTPTLENI